MQSALRLACFAAALSGSAPLLAAPGQLDTTFGSGGIATTAIGSSSTGYAVAVQPDGKVLVAGTSEDFGDEDIALVRYTSSGKLDATFGTGGKVVTDIAGGTDRGKGIALQSDGKILVAGYSEDTVARIDVFFLVRYKADGSLDATFGTGGKVVTAVNPAFSNYASALVLQPDGKILVTGCSDSVTGSYGVSLVRYNTNGSLDATFGTGGIVITPVGDTDAYGEAIRLQPDGKVLVAGTSYLFDAVAGANIGQFTVVRYQANGQLDTTFGDAGKAVTPVGPDAYGVAMVLQDDGKIVVAGDSYDDSFNNRFGLVRFTAGGALDASFGGHGKVITSLRGDDSPTGLALQPDGKLLVSGSSNNGSDDDFAITRFDADGSLDTGFGDDGMVFTPIKDGEGDSGYAIALQDDGKALVAGSSTNSGFAVVRYLGDSPEENSDGGGGGVSTPAWLLLLTAFWAFERRGRGRTV